MDDIETRKAKIQLTLTIDAEIYEDMFGYYNIAEMGEIDECRILEDMETGDIEWEVLEFY